ncbi:MAG: histidine phosphatase family protein [Ramlibacter sp.]|nr:histidine phosphatase family protein [Cryobacterium sp.]
MAERTLILLRHAKSDWSGAETDADRPLADRGLRQAPASGRWLADNVDGIDLAVVSPAARARRTWALASAELEIRPPTRFDDRVYAASAGELLGIVRGLPDDVATVVLVGHNPGFEDLTTLITGERIPMKTSAIAMIGWAGLWSGAGRAPASVRASGRPPQDLPASD